MLIVEVATELVATGEVSTLETLLEDFEVAKTSEVVEAT